MRLGASQPRHGPNLYPKTQNVIKPDLIRLTQISRELGLMWLDGFELVDDLKYYRSPNQTESDSIWCKQTLIGSKRTSFGVALNPGSL